MTALAVIDVLDCYATLLETSEAAVLNDAIVDDYQWYIVKVSDI